MKMLCTALLSCTLLSAAIADEDKPSKTKTVQAKDLTLTVPADWEQVPVRSPFRVATLMVPSAEGDSEKGELSISSFAGGGGELAANVQRWIGQFESKGRESKVVKGKAGDDEYVLVDISGTYNKSVGPPILQRTEPAPGSRMLGIILPLKGKGVYYLKLTGPDKTVKVQKEALRKAFGGDKASEAELDI